MTVSSLLKLGHMLVLCLRRVIMEGLKAVYCVSVPKIGVTDVWKLLAKILMRRSSKRMGSNIGSERHEWIFEMKSSLAKAIRLVIYTSHHLQEVVGKMQTYMAD